MEDSKFFRELPDNQYGEGILLDEYHGTFSLVSARKGKTGEVYMQWCFPQGPDRKPKEKGVPWKVSLGNKEQAIQTLTYFLDILGDSIGASGEEIPF